MIHVVEARHPLCPTLGAARRSIERRPGMRVRDLLPAGEDPAVWAGVRLGGTIGDDEWDEPLLDGEVVVLARSPGFQALAGLPLLAKIVLAAFFSYFTSQIVKTLFGPPKQTAGPDDDSSPSHAFGGTAAVAGEGLPVPVVYGTRRLGGILIGSYVELNGPFFQRLHLMYALCDGEIRGFGTTTQDTEEAAPAGTAGTPTEPPLSGQFLDDAGVQINGQPGGNFGGTVRAWTRRGRLHQAKLPNFPGTILQYPITSGLLDTTSAGGLPSAPGQYASGAEPSWVGLPVVAYTAGDSAERFAARLRWEKGQYDIDAGSGATVPNPVQIQVRYRRVDDFGVPFGDFFVLPAQTIDLKSQSPFSFDLEHTFAGTYSAPAAGQSLSLDGTDDHASKATPNKIPSVPGTSVAISVGCFAKIAAHKDGNWIFHHLAANRGFAMRLRRDPGDPTRIMVEVQMGNGTTTNTYQSPSVPSTQVTGIQTFVGFVYAGSDISFENPTGDGQLAIYLGAALAFSATIPSTFRPLWALSSQTLYVGSQLGSSGSNFNLIGTIDEMFVASRSFDSSQMVGFATKKDQYGNPMQAVDPGEDLVGLWHFDGNALDSATVGTPNNLTLQNGAVASGAGYVYSPESLTPLAGKYKIELLRTDAESTSELAQDETTWSDILLKTDQIYEYPGCAVMSVAIDGSEQLSGGIPNVTNLVMGRKLRVWDGVDAKFPTFTEAWSANPAWVALDVATNPDYGMASAFADGQMDLVALLDAAEYFDERLHDGKAEAAFSSAPSYAAGVVTVHYAAPGPPQFVVGYEVAIDDTATDWDTGSLLGMPILTKSETGGVVTLTATWPPSQAAPAAGPPASGTVEGREPRCQYDEALDEIGRPGWEAIIEVLQAGRSVPIKLGSVLSLFVNRAATPVALFTMANVVRGSFRGNLQGIADRYNSFDLEFWDRDQNYERRVVTRDHGSVVDPTLFDLFRKKQKQRRGITRVSQLYRDADLELETYALVRRGISFETGADAVALLPGDVFRFAHDLTVKDKDLKLWGVSGKLLATSSTASEIKLDRDFTFTAGQTYEVVLRHQTTDELATVAIAASEVPGAGTTTKTAGTAIALAAPAGWTPAQGDLYAIGRTGVAFRDYRCVRLQLDPRTMRRKVVAIEYVAAPYALDEEFGPEQAEATAGTQPARSPVATAAPLGVVGLKVEDVAWRSPGGSVRSAALVSWEHARETAYLVAGASVYARRAGEDRWQHVQDVLGGQASAQVELTQASLGSSWEVLVQAFSRTGRRLPIEVCPRRSVQVRALTQRPAKGLGTRGEARGEAMVYSWTPPTEPNVRWMEARMAGWILGQRVFRLEAHRGQSPALDHWTENPTNWRSDPPPELLIAPILESGVVGAAARLRLSPSPVGFASPLVSQAVEDDWAAGTLSGMEAHPTISHALRISAAGGLTGEYVSPDVVLSRATRVLAHAFFTAYQKHPATFATLAGYPMGSLELQRWTWEGPTWLLPGESQCSATIEWSYSDTASPGSDWRKFEPGIAYLRSCRFRLRFTRPDTTFNVCLRRLGITLREPPAFPAPVSSATPSILRVLDAGAAGSSSDVSRADHAHEVEDLLGLCGWYAPGGGRG